MRNRLGELVAGVALIGTLFGCSAGNGPEGNASGAATQATATATATSGTGAGTGAGTGGGDGSQGRSGTGVLPTTAPAGYSVSLTAAGRTVHLDVATIEGMPQTTIDTPQAGQTTQTGALVSDVLKQAGVASFDSLVVTGSKGAQTFSADEIDGTVILGVSRRQTLRFSGQNIEQNRWVQDVTSINAS